MEVERSRKIYGVIWVVATIAYFFPWFTTGPFTFTGWGLGNPYSVTYLLGIVIGGIVLLGRVKPFWLTIGGGIAMIFGVIRSYSGMTGKLADVAGASGWKTSIETGFAFAFLMANAFLVLGGWISRRMTERELDSFP
ncbi:hypothetical protein AKJ41_04220 [candidate division MSBL1 archaeon SCGC-AAA259O05]|uniref:Uncharacterized protein n=1 Tax=candidate division MSBL1 archaeon SCGC-AAA259O05 TaxID=1698271 RepID=A0A133V1C3_9EURY|nr:hypothetical protein AKJ41_04220 [candidate division MSBL1 archaeon SCGC-AAA259O05]